VKLWRRNKGEKCRTIIVNLVVFVYACILYENLMSFTFCILPISGSTWHCKEEKESRVKEVICGLNVKATSSWIWEQKLKISKDD
jgi:hypothetical protein